MSRILIIEDERPMCAGLEACLEGEGFRVLTAADGLRGLEVALHEQPDLIVLDIAAEHNPTPLGLSTIWT